jgi:hypothetical protein
MATKNKGQKNIFPPNSFFFLLDPGSEMEENQDPG